MSSPQPTDLAADLQALSNRLQRMAKHIGKWARRQGISCYRLYDSDLPDQPGSVDWYDGHCVLWTKRRTRDDSPQADAERVRQVITCVTNSLNPVRTFHKRRQRQKGRQLQGEEGEEAPGQYAKTGEAPFHLMVQEHGRQFLVNLSEYLDVGLFLDHRPTRKVVGDMAAGKRVLNLFAYTGSFSVYAASGGAQTVTTVDLNRRYLEWATENLRLNDFNVGQRFSMIRDDSFAYLAAAHDAGASFDLIVCDPPTFSNSKAMSHTFSVDRDHPRLLAACARVLAPGGTLVFSTNSRRFQLSLPDGLQARDMTAATTDKDFERRPAHHCWFITHQKPAKR